MFNSLDNKPNKKLTRDGLAHTFIVGLRSHTPILVAYKQLIVIAFETGERFAVGIGFGTGGSI